jgi:DNA-binding SARP family transcriptional activator
VEFRILGPLEVAADGELVELGPAKPQALLGALLLRANEVVASNQLVDALWGKTPPATAAKLVQLYVSQLRRGLARVSGEGVLQTRPSGYLASVDFDQLDAERFTRLVGEGRARAEAGETKEAVLLYEEALRLWRGPVLAGLPLESGALVECERLEELHVAALGERVDCELKRGRHAQLVGELEALTATYRLHERFWAQLMLALYRSGRQSDALDAYRRVRRRLNEQVGLEPNSALRHLERAILTQDPSLDLPDDRLLAAPRRRSRLWTTGAALAVAAATIAGIALFGRSGGSTAPSTLTANSVAVIDAARNALVANFRLPTRPAGVAYGSGSVWVAMQDDNTVLRVQPDTLALEKTIGLSAQPSQIAAAGDYVWVLSAIGPGRLFEIDAGTGTIVRTIGLGRRIEVGPLKGARLGTPTTLAAESRAAWLSSGLGLAIRVDARTGNVRQIQATDRTTGYQVAFGAHAAWSPSVTGIARIDPRTLDVTTIPAPDVGYPQSIISVSAAGTFAWVITGENPSRARSVWLIDATVNRVTRVIPLKPTPVATTADARTLWTANADGSISRVDARTGRVRQVPVGKYPRTAYPINLATGGGRVWVAVH